MKFETKDIPTGIINLDCFRTKETRVTNLSQKPWNKDLLKNTWLPTNLDTRFEQIKRVRFI